MKKIYQRLWNAFLILLLLCAGVYILLLQDQRDTIKDECHILSSELTGNIYQSVLEQYKTKKGRYPDSLNELIPDYLSSLYDWKLGYGRDPYYYQAGQKYVKNNDERPASLETLVPQYVPECPTLKYTCDPNGLDYELSLTSETSSYEFTVSITPRGVFWWTPESL
ncbi:MAG: hypothetical protein ACYSUT_06905 [Planctomycetota bacterium]|jgi:hypothetical protein